MKFQSLFSVKSKKNMIKLSSPEHALRVVKVKAPSKMVADAFYFLHYLSENIKLDILCELSARHLKEDSFLYRRKAKQF